jgi:hypothetical protein
MDSSEGRPAHNPNPLELEDKIERGLILASSALHSLNCDLELYSAQAASLSGQQKIDLIKLLSEYRGEHAKLEELWWMLETAPQNSDVRSILLSHS